MGKELVVSLSPDSNLEGTLLSCDNGKVREDGILFSDCLAFTFMWLSSENPQVR